MYLLITNPFDIFYLTGFMADNLLERQSYVLCRVLPDLASSNANQTEQKLPLRIADIQQIWHFLPEMFAASSVQDMGKVVGRVVLKPGTKLSEQVRQIISKDTIGDKIDDKDSAMSQTLYFQPEDMRYQEVTSLRDNLDLKLEPMADMLTYLRRCKSELEVERIRLAAQRSEAVYEQLLDLLKPGITELQLRKAILEELGNPKFQGFESAFDPIVAFGENSAIPHHRATARALTEGDIVLIDMGASYQGYNADICRTSIFRPSADEKKLFSERLARVESALQAASEYFGSKAQRLDGIARQQKLIDKSSDVATPEKSNTARRIIHSTSELSDLMQAALGQQYPLIHAFGHGLGLQVHEGPHISNLGKTYQFQGGEVIALEPAIYIPGWGGIRVEYNYFIKTRPWSWNSG